MLLCDCIQGRRMKNRKEEQPLARKDFPFILHLSSFILLTAALLLSSCGFQLRGQASLPFDSLYVSGPQPFANQISRAVRTGSQARIASVPGDAQVRLEILNEVRERAILSLSSGGRAREITLTYRVPYRIYSEKKKEYVQASEIV